MINHHGGLNHSNTPTPTSTTRVIPGGCGFVTPKRSPVLTSIVEMHHQRVNGSTAPTNSGGGSLPRLKPQKQKLKQQQKQQQKQNGGGGVLVTPEHADQPVVNSRSLIADKGNGETPV